MRPMIVRSAFAAAVLLSFAQPAAATAIYSAAAQSSFAITGATSVVVFDDDGDKFDVFVALAAFNGSTSPAGTLPATSNISANGKAGGPFGLATSFYDSSHVFTIDNAGGRLPISLTFDFTYSWTTTVGVNDP